MRGFCLLDRGGLGDREYAFNTIGEHARQLRVKLYIPQPCKSFAKLHNQGRDVSCNKTWSDFFELPPHIVVHQKEPCRHVYRSRAFKYHYTARFPINLTCSEYKNLRLQPYMYDVVHIRRNDVLWPHTNKMYNNSYFTSVAHVTNVVKEMHNPYFPLVYTTDEQNTSYLNSLHKSMKEANNKSIYLDGFLQNYCSDNYCTYCAYRQLVQFHRRHMSFGRHS